MWATQEIHLKRDLQRPTDAQMRERVIILRKEFLQSDTLSYFFIDNTSVNLAYSREGSVFTSLILVKWEGNNENCDF